ncbi:hypothetical protein PHYC_03070 [Phycisphaerales bacterium]|nr:hypothetical protein PHYC_03070 [Phycisphaerales bacterium]
MKKRWAILRWACTAGLALAIAAYAFSAFYTAWVTWNPPYRRITLRSGGVGLSWEGAGWFGTCRTEVLSGRAGPFRWWFDIGGAGSTYRAHIPLWCPTLLFATPAVLLWRSYLRARRVTNPCPKCNYPLTGLAPGSPCPECGKRG